VARAKPVRRFLTVGHLARRLGVLEFHVRTMANDRQIPHALAGRARLFAEEDVPAIEATARRLGFLTDGPKPAA
jgi:excisionase family DNA binding protein